jgi:hypothetical protein
LWNDWQQAFPEFNLLLICSCKQFSVVSVIINIALRHIFKAYLLKHENSSPQPRNKLRRYFSTTHILATSTIQNMESVSQHRCAEQYYKGRRCSFSFHTNRQAEQGKEKVWAILLFPSVAAVFIQVCEFSYDDTHGQPYTVRFKTGR